MTKPEMLRVLRLLSALESWCMAQDKMPPDYLFDQMSELSDRIEGYVLEGVNEPRETHCYICHEPLPCATHGTPTRLLRKQT
jgi:hypothetical protein